MAIADRYDRTTITLHWLTAGLVMFQWGQAHLIDLVTSSGTPGRRAMRVRRALRATPDKDRDQGGQTEGHKHRCEQ